MSERGEEWFEGFGEGYSKGYSDGWTEGVDEGFKKAEENFKKLLEAKDEEPDV